MALVVSTHAPNLYIRDVLFVFLQISTIRSVNSTALGVHLIFLKCQMVKQSVKTPCSKIVGAPNDPKTAVAYVRWKGP